MFYLVYEVYIMAEIVPTREVLNMFLFVLTLELASVNGTQPKWCCGKLQFQRKIQSNTEPEECIFVTRGLWTLI